MVVHQFCHRRWIERNWLCNGFISSTIIYRIVKTTQQALKDLQEGKLNLEGEGIGFDEFKEIIGFKEWSLLDEKYTTKE